MRFLNLMKQDLRNLLTNPTALLFCTIYPIFLVLLFGFLFSDLYKSGGVTSYDFYGVTMLFYLSTQAATITPIAFMEERTKKANMRIAYAPISRVSIYLSKLITTFLFIEIAFLVQISILNITGLVNYGGENFGAILLLLTLLLAFSVSLGGAVCSAIKSEDLSNKILGIIINTLAIFSGVFFPIAELGQLAESISNLSPVKMIITTAFQIIYDSSFAEFAPTIIITLISTTVLIYIIHKKYKIENYI